MPIGLDEPFHYGIAYEEIRPGWWVAHIDAPALKLQVEDAYFVAISGDDVEFQAVHLIRRMIWRLRTRTLAELN